MRRFLASLDAAPALLLLLTLPACGARTTLQGEASAGSGDSGSGGAGATTSSSTGAGGGSPVFTCSHLQWTGAPLEVPLGAQWPRATTPKIIAFPGQSTHLISFANAQTDGTIEGASLFSVFDPFGAWPPLPDVVHSFGAGKGGFVVSPDPTHTVDFATFVNATFTVEKVAADATVQPIVSFPSVAGPLRFIAASESAYLIGTGSTSQLDLHGIVNPKQMSILQGLGCATTGTLADGVALASGKFLVASTTADSSLCGASNPPSPPTEVQVQLVDVEHEKVTLIDMPSQLAPIETLAVAPRAGGGAWMAFSSELSSLGSGREQLLYAYDDQGNPLGLGPVFLLEGNKPIPPSVPIAYGVASGGGLVAEVRVVTPDALPGGQFQLMVSADVACGGPPPQLCPLPPSAYLSLASLPGDHVAGSAASIAVSPDGQSVLVAFVEGNGTTKEPTMTLARADCAAPN
jgi:hypothetical protein